jgi:hypothetical protein
MTATMYRAYCGSFAVVDTDPQRARSRAISELASDCGGLVHEGSWAWERIQECRQREPEPVDSATAAAISASNWNAWAWSRR